MPRIKTKGRAFGNTATDKEWQVGNSAAGFNKTDWEHIRKKSAKQRSGAENSAMKDGNEEGGDTLYHAEFSGGERAHDKEAYSRSQSNTPYPDALTTDQPEGPSPEDFDRAYAIDEAREMPDDWTDDEADFLFKTTGVSREEASAHGTEGRSLQDILDYKMINAMKEDGKSESEIFEHMKGTKGLQ